MSWITESDLNSAQANVRLAQALAAAQWNPARVALPQDVLSKVTELVIPEGTHPEVQNVRYQYDMSPYKNGLFAKMPNLKKVVIGNRTALPSYYFAFLKAEEVQVPVDIADVDDRPSNLFTNSSVKRVLVTAPSSPCDWEELARDGRSLFWESKIQSIRFAEGIECVPRNCCYGCSVLESVELPRSCRIIGCYAF